MQSGKFQISLFKKIGILMTMGVLHSVSAWAADGVELGPLSVAGNGCYQAPNALDVVLADGKLQVPLSLMSKKINSAAFARGVCSLALPISVDSGHRLVLADSKIIGLLNLPKETSAAVNVEIFKAGSRGMVQSVSEEAKDKRLKKPILLEQPGDVLALECGESAILRVNSSALLKGAARATASLRLLEMTARVELCQ